MRQDKEGILEYHDLTTFSYSWGLEGIDLPPHRPPEDCDTNSAWVFRPGPVLLPSGKDEVAYEIVELGGVVQAEI